MRLLFAFFMLFITCSSAASASDEPIIGPVPDWVEQISLPEANPAMVDRPFQTLLISAQSRYDVDQQEHFAEFAHLLQTQQGLQGLGTVVLPWRPLDSDLVIHKARIIRGETIIDLLAGGHSFTVLRRENNLESAMLDGTLTAVLQPEGLTVGDILNVSFTVRKRPGALPLRAENFFALTPHFPFRRFHVRQVWPRNLPVRWEASDAIGQPTVRRTRLGTELVLNRTDSEGPDLPTGAPARFLFPAMLQVSQFRDWGELSALVAPHYGQAQLLPPGSTLRAEIDRIAESTQDPRERAMAALRLVQDEVRYFALTLGDGNYLPASAEETWTRRYGDCKGKTVMLVAMLRGLGIEAEPLLVHSTMGDALPIRLPQMQAFDHVIVRAVIGGRSYWLDGTRTGDRTIEDLASSPFAWGLPVRTSGAELEELPYEAPRLPLYEYVVVHDGSQGLEGPVATRIETIYRGDFATGTRQGLSMVGRDVFLREFREGLVGTLTDGEEIDSVDIQDDPEHGSLSIIATGKTRLNWRPAPGSNAQRVWLRTGATGFDLGLDRPDGDHSEIPFALPIPAHTLYSETIILPDGGAGYSVEGEAFDHQLAGTQVSREVRLEGNRAIARSRFRHFRREASADEVRTAQALLDNIRGDRVYLRAPVGAVLAQGSARSTTPAGPASETTPTTAEEFNDRGFRRIQSGELSGALGDFEAAARLSPEWSRPLSNQAIIMVHRQQYDEAEELLARATELDSEDFVIPQAQGLMFLARNRPVQAVVAFTQSLEREAGNIFTLFGRAEAYQQLAAFDGALADFESVLRSEPSNGAALAGKMRIHAWRGDADEALASADALVATDPGNPFLMAPRAVLLRRFGRAEAEAAFDEVLAALDRRISESGGESGDWSAFRHQVLAEAGRTAEAIRVIDSELASRPRDAQLLNSRCWTLATANFELERALTDCEQAVSLAPDRASILDSRAFVKLRLGRIEEAIEDSTAALALAPDLPASLYVRGIALLRKGDREAGERDLAAARRLVFDIDTSYRGYGVTP